MTPSKSASQIKDPYQTFSFSKTLQDHKLSAPRGTLHSLQIHLGKTAQQSDNLQSMSRQTAARVLELLHTSNDVETVEILGQPAEYNPHLRWLVGEAGKTGRRILLHCRLATLSDEGLKDLPEFLRQQGVCLVTPLPWYLPEDRDRAQASENFDRAIEMLRSLNALGYGLAESELKLDLVYSPIGTSLPPTRDKLEAVYKAALKQRFSVEFNRLLTARPVPVPPLREQLIETGQLESHLQTLVAHFTPATVDKLTCRHSVTIAWDGKLYDCHYNHALNLETAQLSKTIWDLRSLQDFNQGSIAQRWHCFGCTAHL